MHSGTRHQRRPLSAHQAHGTGAAAWPGSSPPSRASGRAPGAGVSPRRAELGLGSLRPEAERGSRRSIRRVPVGTPPTSLETRPTAPGSGAAPPLPLRRALLGTSPAARSWCSRRHHVPAVAPRRARPPCGAGSPPCRAPPSSRGHSSVHLLHHRSNPPDSGSSNTPSVARARLPRNKGSHSAHQVLRGRRAQSARATVSAAVHAVRRSSSRR